MTPSLSPYCSRAHPGTVSSVCRRCTISTSHFLQCLGVRPSVCQMAACSQSQQPVSGILLSYVGVGSQGELGLQNHNMGSGAREGPGLGLSFLSSFPLRRAPTPPPSKAKAPPTQGQQAGDNTYLWIQGGHLCPLLVFHASQGVSPNTLQILSLPGLVGPSPTHTS